MIWLVSISLTYYPSYNLQEFVSQGKYENGLITMHWLNYVCMAHPQTEGSFKENCSLRVPCKSR